MLEYKKTGTSDWTSIANITNSELTEYELNITGIPLDIYLLQITTSNLIGGESKSSQISINIGPITPLLIFERTENLIGFVVLITLISGGIDFSVTTYRHKMQQKRAADIEGCAIEYIEYAKRIKDD